MWVMIWCMISQGAPPLLTGCSPSWNFINFQIYWTIDPGLVCICVPAPWQLIDQANSRRNSHTTNIHAIHNRTWWFSSLKDNLVSEKECLIGIIFRNCQRTGIIVKDANGLMVRAKRKPCSQMSCLPCGDWDLVLVSIVMNAREQIVRGEGGGALMVLVIKLTMETPETSNWPRWSVTDTRVGGDPPITDVSQLLKCSSLV